MDEEKKAESSGDELERVGPYQLQEQVPQDDYSRGALYRATHETSGATVMLYKPAAKDPMSPGPLPDFRAHITSSAVDGYLAMAAEDSPRYQANDKQSVESLVCTFEDVREALGRMGDALHASTKPHPWWRLGLALAGVAAVLVVVLLPTTLSPVAEVRVQKESSEEMWTTGAHVDAVPIQSGEAPHPRKNQKRAPCDAILEREVSGVCWIATEHAPPKCPPQTVSYDGKCLLPVATPRPVPASVDGGEAR
jgi:hypothetical protein